MYGILRCRESYNDSQNFSIKTAMVSDGVVWHGIISLYKDAETNIIGLSLTTPLSEGALEKLFPRCPQGIQTRGARRRRPRVYG